MSDSKKNHRGLEPEVTEKLQRQAAELAESVDAGDYAKAMTLINELSEVRDQSLYREVGRLTRSLHEAIRNFQIDPRNAEQQEALSKMTDASDRLEYVVQMTGEAANRTMDLVEETMPVANAFREEAASLRDEWQRLRRREMQPAEFRNCTAVLIAFLSAQPATLTPCTTICRKILLAQDYQDLTGQVIQKVTALVKEVEEQMLSLVVMASHVDQLTGTVHQIEEKEESAERASGPRSRPMSVKM